MAFLKKSSLGSPSDQASFRTQEHVRIRIKGKEHLSRYGKALLIHLHPNFLELCAILLGYVFRKEFKKIPRYKVVLGIFRLLPLVKEMSKQASIRDGLKLLGRNIPAARLLGGIEEKIKFSFKDHPLQKFSPPFSQPSSTSHTSKEPFIFIEVGEKSITFRILKIGKLIADFNFPIPLNLFHFPNHFKK